MDTKTKIDLNAKRPWIDWEGRTINDVLKDLNAALKEAGCEYGFAPKWWDGNYAANDLWPVAQTGRCWPACYAVRGASEGYYCHIDMVFNEKPDRFDMKSKNITFVKCWTWQEAYELATLSAQILGATI